MGGGNKVTSDARCARARESMSLRVDGEISDLETRLLERHVDRCTECGTFEERIRSTTALLRGAPPETPGRAFRAPARAETAFPVRRRVVAALLAAALALGALVGALARPPDRAPQPTGPEVSLLSRDVRQLRELPRTQRVEPAPARVRTNPPEGAGARVRTNPPEGAV